MASQGAIQEHGPILTEKRNNNNNDSDAPEGRMRDLRKQTKYGKGEEKRRWGT